MDKRCVCGKNVCRMTAFVPLLLHGEYTENSVSHVEQRDQQQQQQIGMCAFAPGGVGRLGELCRRSILSIRFVLRAMFAPTVYVQLCVRDGDNCSRKDNECTFYGAIVCVRVRCQTPSHWIQPPASSTLIKLVIRDSYTDGNVRLTAA